MRDHAYYGDRTFCCVDGLKIRAAEPLEARGVAPTQTPTPAGRVPFPAPYARAYLLNPVARFALVGWHRVFGDR